MTADIPLRCGDSAREARAPWYAAGLRFSCVGCGRCCGNDPGTVAFTSVEEERMARCLGMDTAGFRARYTWRKYGILSLREIENYDCVFLRREGTRARCKIYPVRPAQCRAFPFWPEVMKNERTWNSYSLSCPGMNGGVLHSIAEINGYIGQ